jgi:hypothetical protein
MESIVGGLTVIWLLGIFLVLVWIFLPFALIGMKPLLRELIRETKKTNAILERQLGAGGEPAGGVAPSATNPVEPTPWQSGGVWHYRGEQRRDKISPK